MPESNASSASVVSTKVPCPAAPDLSIGHLRQQYAEGSATPVSVIESIYRLMGDEADATTWIHRVSREDALARAASLMANGASTQLPLYGIPFAVKDNIDVAGIPTTAACPAFAYTPEVSATVVQRLLDAGAILIGKTNLDQFATGLVGARSPYGIPGSVFNPEYVSGGSSSGSAVAVAAGVVSFALGTDTAGSGRVPASFNNIVGAKPTRGWLSCKGVVPACRSLDCVSVFALTSGDAWEVLRVAGAEDPADPWSRAVQPEGLPARPRIGVPRVAQREFFGDALAAAQYERALSMLEAFGDIIEIDYAPFTETAGLLYHGPWVAERLEATGDLLRTNPEAIDPAVRDVISKGLNYSAADAHAGQTRLQALRKRVAENWQHIDLLAFPTAPTHYRISEIRSNPVELNTRLGYYTNFANLLDLCALAVPTGMRPDGLPFGITLFAPAGHDAALAALGDALHRSAGLRRGATSFPVTPSAVRFEWAAQRDAIRLAVVGAHLEGMPLNRELRERAARFERRCKTAPDYKLYALPGTVPPKPGMQKVASGGVAFEVEVWELSPAAFGDFVARIPAPLGIGTLKLEDGELVKGFLCEAHALEGAQDISEFGGWRNYLGGK